MKSKTVVLTMLVALSCLQGLAQQPTQHAVHHPLLPPLPDRFEEAIEVAMGESPEVVMARVKMQAAAAELRQKRLETIREITVLWEERLKIEQQLAAGPNAVPQEESDMLRMELETIVARLRYCIGIGVPMERLTPERPQLPLAPRPRPAIPAALHEKLQQPVTFESGITLGKALDMLAEQSQLQFVPGLDIPLGEIIPRAPQGPMPVEMALMVLADQLDFVAFVLRDYGVLVTHKERALHTEGPAIPSDLPFFAVETGEHRP